MLTRMRLFRIPPGLNGRPEPRRTPAWIRAICAPVQVLALTAGLALVVPGAHAESRRHELIYGAELMTAAERQAYRRAHESQREESARAQYERQHRERLQLRARRQGVELREPDGVVSRGDRSGARPGTRP
jgi:hypothetical protein